MSNGSKPTFNSALNKMMGDAWVEVKGDFSHGSTLDKPPRQQSCLERGICFWGLNSSKSCLKQLRK
ncbi:hypothetical protein HX776_05605 [Pseudomonas agarici]|uniref:hypothetical protein n=1 Tax=Pseudomonas agarici TaxID=46677 RepID=UPI00115F7DA9|nr:hypothetical protein [Pseudomonas agarici]NWC08302.1 hypothetical protein [Pseudomonas agarici]